MIVLALKLLMKAVRVGLSCRVVEGSFQHNLNGKNRLQV